MSSARNRTMQKHPDADAFMQAYLAQPTDATSRLVFADWLEETGEAHNRAWAYYIRLKIEADRHPPDSPPRRELNRRADEYATHIRAKLTIAAKLFVGYPKSLLELLPGPNITVRLSVFDPWRAVLEFVPESVARENLILPLDMQARTLLIAAVNPRDTDLAQKLSFILNRDIVFVGAEEEDIRAALNRHFGDAEYENFDSPPLYLTEFVTTQRYVLPGDALADPAADNAAVAPLVNQLFTEAVYLRADRILLYPDIDAVGVRYRIDGEWTERDRVPIRLLRALTARVALMAQIDAERVVGAGSSAESPVGEILLRIRGLQLRFGVTMLPSPDGPTTQINITREPA